MFVLGKCKSSVLTLAVRLFGFWASQVCFIIKELEEYKFDTVHGHAKLSEQVHHKVDQGKKPIKRDVRPLTILSRDDWGAKPPVGDVPEFRYKPNFITFTFNTRSPQCHSREECIRVVQGIQETDIAGGQPDIDYNFLVGGDGNVYEGRGWTKRVSFTRKDPPTEHPLQTLDIGVIGDYTGKGWPHVMLLTIHQFIGIGVEKNYIQSSYFFG